MMMLLWVVLDFVNQLYYKLMREFQYTDAMYYSWIAVCGQIYHYLDKDVYGSYSRTIQRRRRSSRELARIHLGCGETSLCFPRFINF